MTHVKIMKRAAKALEKDSQHYQEDKKYTHSKIKKQHDAVEKKEAMSAAKDLKKRIKKSHEY